jgi:hypothetical protein
MRMSYVMRTTMVIGACTIAAATAGCGSVAGGATTSSNSISVPPAASASPGSCTNPQLSSATSPVTQVALTVGDLPPGGPAVEQISDGKMNRIANTDQRGFANAGNTYRIEDDVVLDTSVPTAAADYPQLRDAAKTQFATITTTSSPLTLGCQADVFIGTAATGYSQVGVAFQDGDVIAVVLVVNAAAPVDPAFAQAVALAQDQKIVAAAT